MQARSVMDVVGAAHAPPQFRRCFLKLRISSPMWRASVITIACEMHWPWYVRYERAQRVYGVFPQDELSRQATSPWVVGWGIAAAAAVHDVHVRVHDLRSRRAECAAAYTRRARAGTAKEKKRKGTKNPERRVGAFDT